MSTNYEKFKKECYSKLPIMREIMNVAEEHGELTIVKSVAELLEKHVSNTPEFQNLVKDVAKLVKQRQKHYHE